MLFTELTTENQAILQHSTNYLFRETFGALAKLTQSIEAVKDDWIGQSAEILATLDAGEIVPNNSGLPGTKALSKEEIEVLAGWLNDFLAEWGTASKKQTYVTVAGAKQTLIIG